jgi:alpha-tubulin suppressor-like RCC1 family protein
MDDDDDGGSVFQWIQDSEAKSREHEEAVKSLIARHETAGKVGSRWRINVLKKALIGTASTTATTGGGRGARSSALHAGSSSSSSSSSSSRMGIANQQQVFKHFEPELVKLAAAINKDRRKKAQKRRIEVMQVKGHGGGPTDNKLNMDSSELLSRPGSPPGSDEKPMKTRRRRRRRRRRKKRSENPDTPLGTDADDIDNPPSNNNDDDDGDGGSGEAPPLEKPKDVNFHPLLQLSGERINVVEGGATDFYSVNLRRRPRGVVHVAIQDPHLQVTVEPRVLRFNSRNFRTPQLVCVSAVDDTDKSSESVESTVLEHVTASADAQFDRIRFEVPVSIADNDGHYLWGFGSNVYRQLGSDSVGPASTLPTAILGRLNSTRQTRSGSRGSGSVDTNSSSRSSNKNNSNSNSNSGSDNSGSGSENDEGGGNGDGGHGGSRNSAVTLGTSPQAIRTIKKVGKRTSFVSNAKQSKPSMLFASIAAGRHTTITTQTNGNTTMYGRNDGRDWFDSRTMMDGPPINMYSCSIGNSKTYIVSVSAGSFHCAALSVDGQLLTWGRNDCGQLGIGKTGDLKEQNQQKDEPRTEEVEEDPVVKAKRKLREKYDELDHRQSAGIGRLARKKTKNKQHEVAKKKSLQSKMQAEKACMVHHPTPVGGVLTGVRVMTVSCGDQHTAAIAGIDQQLYCWGRAVTGALGLNSRQEVESAQAVKSSAVKSSLQIPVWVPGLSDRPLTPEDDRNAADKEEDKAKKRRRRRRMRFGRDGQDRRRGGSGGGISETGGIMGGIGGGWSGGIVGAAAELASNVATEKKKKKKRVVMSEPEGTCGGDVSMADTWFPVLVEMPLTEEGGDPGPPFQVDCGYAHTAVLCGAGRLYTCGWGGKGRLGRPIPVLTSTGSPAKGGGASSGPYRHQQNGGITEHATDQPILRLFFEAADPFFRQVRMPRTCDGPMAVLARRQNRNGNRGRRRRGTAGGSEIAGEDKKSHRTLVVSVACGLAHTICLSSDRMLWSWGDNSHGQLGLGHRNACPLPRLARVLLPFSRNFKVKSKKLTRLGGDRPQEHHVGLLHQMQHSDLARPRKDLLAAIACGDNHSAVITEDGLLYVWGSNEFGQLGLGSACTEDEHLPRLHHPTLSLDVRQLSVGANHTLAITAECPDRVYHAKSTFEEVIRGQKRLVDKDIRRRSRFQRRVNMQEMARKVKRWRHPASVMVPSTKKAHARTMTIQRAIYRETFAPPSGHSKKKKKKKMLPQRPGSANPSSLCSRFGARGDGGRGGGGGGGYQKLSAASAAALARPSSAVSTGRPPRRWEVGMKPRPDFETMRKKSPYENSPSRVNMINNMIPMRPQTADGAVAARKGGSRRAVSRPKSAAAAGRAGRNLSH